MGNIQKKMPPLKLGRFLIMRQSKLITALVSLFFVCLAGCSRHHDSGKDYLVVRQSDTSLSCSETEKEIELLGVEIMVYDIEEQMNIYRYNSNSQKYQRIKRYNHLVKLANDKKCTFKQPSWMIEGSQSQTP